MLTPYEFKQLERCNGRLGWLADHLGMDLSFGTSVSKSISTKTATVQKLLEANAIVKKAKANPKFTLKFRRFHLTRSLLSEYQMHRLVT